jgi:hypothetical protein
VLLGGNREFLKKFLCSALPILMLTLTLTQNRWLLCAPRRLHPRYADCHFVLYSASTQTCSDSCRETLATLCSTSPPHTLTLTLTENHLPPYAPLRLQLRLLSVSLLPRMLATLFSTSPPPMLTLTLTKDCLPPCAPLHLHLRLL